MSSSWYALVMILVIAFVTIALRFLPFFIFSGNKPVPKFVNYLGKVLPYSIMAMLVVYCLKGISFAKAPFGLPELISVAVVAILHVWRRNTLFSIIYGTICYMVLIQFVF
ncbi:MAG: AzlD domain-containing protein [Lachnospiraceae bacterium]|nr:AzlD domain-containing protein [Lachnospiraceae bacterium]